MSAATPFRIGLSGCGGGLETISDQGLFELAALADDLGYECLWINEEHFQGGTNPEEGRRCLSPIVVATALAARTRRIRIGFSVIVLPLHHPLRLAEDIATLDVLSGGRVDLGISRGTNPKYLAAYGLKPEEIAPRFEAGLDFIRRAWTEPMVDFGGEALPVEPKPAQRPHPPLYMATYTADTAAWAARSGLKMICHGINSLANLRPIVGAFRDAGGDTREMPFGRFIYVSETDESARRELLPTVVNLTGRMRAAGLFRRPNIITEAELEPERYLEEMVIAGSPATCAARISALAGEFGLGYVNALSAFFGHLPLELLRRSLELLATEVRPRIGM
ncbi:LLM class flavin-dependent oxidoreductase [Xanthobacter autotrophicus DSM 431]|uniref:LLM class flavin-dependent oxidoreductase n=1 Tax=Xanthobacter nonsaccharivorans TaxID=3119912 RepID=UPI00372825A7